MEQQKFDNLKKETEKLKELKWQVRGESLKSLKKFILKKEGKEAYAKYKNILNKLGIDINSYENKKNTEWIPGYVALIALVASVQIFDWSKDTVFEMGKLSISYSATAKMFLKYFVSIKRTFKQTIKQWNNYYTQGNFEIKELDIKNKNAVLILKDFPTHPLELTYIQGMIAGIVKLSTGSKEIKIKETKCMSRGDDYHEFYVQW